MMCEMRELYCDQLTANNAGTEGVRFPGSCSPRKGESEKNTDDTDATDFDN
jgi:hypothetical protein